MMAENMAIIDVLVERDVLKAENAKLRDALKFCLDALEIDAKMRAPDWDGTATPFSAIGRAREALG